jgi:hypothetical protein
MRYSKWFMWCALAAGMAAPGARALSAADRDDWYAQRNRPDLRADYRDMRHDHTRVDRMSADIARDRARLNEDIRCGRSDAAAEDARDLARDQQALNAQLHDIQRDRSDVYYDRNAFRGR